MSRLLGGILHHIGRYDDWALAPQVAFETGCAGVQFKWTAGMSNFWRRRWSPRWLSLVFKAVSHLLLRLLLMIRNIVPNNVRGGAVRHLRHLISLLVVPRPRHVVEALSLVRIPHMVLGLREALVLPSLVRDRVLLDLEIGLVLHCRLAPGDSKPTAIDGDALQLAQGRERIAPLLELNEGSALEGPVHVSNLAKILEEVSELLGRHGLVDAANEQGRIAPVGGKLAGPVWWRRWPVAWWVAKFRMPCPVWNRSQLILYSKLESSFRNGGSGEIGGDRGRMCLLGCGLGDNRNRDKACSYGGWCQG